MKIIQVSSLNISSFICCCYLKYHVKILIFYSVIAYISLKIVFFLRLHSEIFKEGGVFGTLSASWKKIFSILIKKKQLHDSHSLNMSDKSRDRSSKSTADGRARKLRLSRIISKHLFIKKKF